MLSLVTIYWFIRKLRTIKTKFRVLVPMLIKIQISGCRKVYEVSFLSLWEKTLRTFRNHLHNVRWYDYTNIMFFSLSIITLLSSFYSLACTLEYELWYDIYILTVPCPPCRRQWQPDHGDPPPLVQNHAKTWWVLGRHRKKIYRRIAGVSARWFGATAAVALPLPPPCHRRRCYAILMPPSPRH